MLFSFPLALHTVKSTSLRRIQTLSSLFPWDELLAAKLHSNYADRPAAAALNVQLLHPLLLGSLLTYLSVAAIYDHTDSDC
jgi:hypothetical protein